MTSQDLHDPERFRSTAHRLVDLLADHLAAAQEREVSARPVATPPERLQDWGVDESGTTDPIDLFTRAVDHAHHVLSPDSIGHQVAPPMPEAALADFVASTLNNSAAIFDMGPAATASESNLVDWMCARLGMPEGSGGALVNGGSLGNLTALLAIRQAQASGDPFGDGTDGRRYCVLSSAQTHYCVRRAVQILGFGHDGLIEVPVGDGYRLDPEALPAALEHARSLGREPLAVVGSAASTSTGAIDPLDAIADFCEEHGLWFHVDGAHGASFVLSDREREKLLGIERADSVVWDAHKTMLVPSLCTGVLFRDQQHLGSAFAQKADYLFAEDGPALDLGRHTIECTKPWIGLKLYAVLATLGTERLSRYLEEQVDAVRSLARAVDAADDFEAAHEPDLNILCFRHRPEGLSGVELDQHQDQLRDEVVRSTETFLTRTVLDDRTWLRVTVLHPGSGPRLLSELLDRLRMAAGRLEVNATKR